MPKVEDSKLGAVVSWLFLLGFFVLAWYWGFQIGATALADPDSCWLISVGKWIGLHNMLPSADPFSWTSQDASTIAGQAAVQHLPDAPGQTYVPYQWLASVLFWGLYHNLGTASLLFFVSLIVIIAYALIPLFVTRKVKASIWMQIILSVLAVSAGSFHFPMRPELFSYLFISLLQAVLICNIFAPPIADASKDSPGTSVPLRPTAISGFNLFALWANLHSGFVLGLLILGISLLFASIGTAFSAAENKSQARAKLAHLAVFAGAAVIGTLFTPFVFRLYAYLPGLFFSPINKFNQELLPLTARSLMHGDYFPFLILQIAFVISCLLLIVSCCLSRSKERKQEDGQSLATSPLQLSILFAFAVLAGCALVAGDCCRRMIPFAVLILIAHFVAISSCHIFGGSTEPVRNLPLLKFCYQWVENINGAFTKLLSPKRNFLIFTTLTLIAIFTGTATSAAVFSAELPQVTFGFDSPTQAVAYISKNRPSGNMLNDPQFGDVLIFALDDKARVFIDTRFDVYGSDYCHDYFVMANCLPGYEKLLHKYKIDWLFFPQQAPILGRLSQNKGWKSIYQDRTAVIMVKQNEKLP